MIRIALLLVMLGCSTAGAEEPERQHGGWAGMDAGFARLKRTYSVTPATSDNAFTLHFRGGYFWNPQLLLGVELGGWTLEPTDKNNPNKGDAIETFFAIARYYPRASSLLFVEGGFGWLNHWTEHPLEQGGTGTGATLGIGQEYRWRDRIYLTGSVDYSQGQVNGIVSPPGVHQDERYRALTLRLGVTYH
jgi:hypothetical protein